MIRCGVLVFALATGCAWGSGDHFATLSAEIATELPTPADRDLGDGWQKLASELEVNVSRLVLDIEEVALIDNGGASVDFDPANPPDGYSLCHNGHCHADDGSLVDFEDIAAELAEGGGAAPIVLLPVGEIDVAAGEARALSCVPECGLPLAQIGLATMAIARIEVGGLVRDGRPTPLIAGEALWTAAIDLEASGDEFILSALIDLPADREHDPDVSLSIRLELGVDLFDEVDWDSITAGTGGFDLGTSEAAIAAVTAALAETELQMEIRR